jgi:hypothetical protein
MLLFTKAQALVILLIIIRGIFVIKHVETPFWSSFPERHKLVQRSRTFFPGIGVTNTMPL